jgi:hypothetical protein
MSFFTNLFGPEGAGRKMREEMEERRARKTEKTSAPPVIPLSVHEEVIAKLKADFESKLREMNEYYTSALPTNIEKDTEFPEAFPGVLGCGAGAGAKPFTTC